MKRIYTVKDSFNSLCVNLTGCTSDGIIIRDEDWQYLARRFAAADAAICAMPEWVTNPSEALRERKKTFEDFKHIYDEVATPACCPNYTLEQLFEYIVTNDDEFPVADVFSDKSYASDKAVRRLYKELATAIGKAYLGLYNVKGSPQQFLKGIISGYGLGDVSNLQKYLAYLEARKEFCDNFHTGTED